MLDPALARTLTENRPEGTHGSLTVDGVRCPTITSDTAVPKSRPYLFVHGLGHDAWDWTPLFARMSSGMVQRAKMTAFDLPGFGLADKPERPASPDGAWGMRILVDAVLAAASACDAPPVVVASSLGGHAAILAALEEPEVIHSLVLLAPGGLVEVPALLQATLRAYYSADAIAQRPEAEIVENSRRIFVNRNHALCEPLVARKLAVRRSPAAREFAVPFAGVVDDVFRHVVLDRFAQLRVPTVVAVGARDVVVPPDACALAARRLGCRFVSFANVGHAPHLEAPDACADMILSFAGAT